MAIRKIHYQNSEAQKLLVEALDALLEEVQDEPIFVCIGSDRHLLDCFGPLTGTMLRDLAPDTTVCGTLDSPLHARNLIPGITEARQQYPGKLMVAIDASVGTEDEIGVIQLRPGGLVPGRALAKNLPTVGQFSITGVVDIRLNQKIPRHNKQPGLGLVYNMARLLSRSISEWSNKKRAILEICQ